MTNTIRREGNLTDKMSQTKHNEGISSHLMRIFRYGDEVAETHRVNSFLEFLNTSINPFTGRAYELGARSLYRYISGEQQYPVDLMPPLVSWSKDEKLMAAYNIYPAPSEMEAFKEKLEHERADLRKHAERVKMLEGRLKVPGMKNK